jgi:hypothetical protein
LAVATVTGADGVPSTDALSPLVGHDVILWPDSDEAGMRHMQRIAAELSALGVKPRWLLWREAPPKGDAADLPSGESGNLLLRQLIADAAEDLSAETSNLGAVERKARFRTAREIAAETPASVPWIAEGFAAVGAIAEVDGKIKAAGKTTLVTHLCRRVLDGHPFLDRPTAKTGVVFLTEQPQASFLQALRRAELHNRDDFLVLFWHDTPDLEWFQVVDLAVKEAQARGYQLLVVNTPGQFARITGDGENNSGAALEAMQPLQLAAARDGLAVIITRHERKSGGDVGDSGRGSSAFAGAADIVIALRRAEGQSPANVRVLKSLSRFDETPPELVIQYRDGTYQAIGTEQDVRRQEARAKLLATLPGTEADAIAMEPLYKEQAISRTTCQAVLNDLMEDGIVGRVGQGKRNDPYRFWRRSMFLPAESHAVSAESNGTVY